MACVSCGTDPARPVRMLSNGAESPIAASSRASSWVVRICGTDIHILKGDLPGAAATAAALSGRTHACLCGCCADHVAATGGCEAEYVPSTAATPRPRSDRGAEARLPNPIPR